MKQQASSATMVVGTRELSKKFGDRVVVDQVDLDIPSGVCFGVLGPNGAGKTTFALTYLP